MVLPQTVTSPGFTLTVDNLEATDTHNNPPSEAVTVTPDTIAAGTTVNNLVVQTELPLFADPTVEFSMGPGLLVENVRILDPHTAIADVTANSHIESEGHGTVVQTDSYIASGCIDTSGGGQEGNTCPAVDYDAPTGLTAGEPFSVTMQVDDVDFDYLMVEAVVENPNVGFDEIIFQDTGQLSYTVPNTVTFNFAGMPPGDYVVLGIAADKVGPFSGNLVEKPFTVLDMDETPAECKPTEFGRNELGQPYVLVEVEDRGYGLKEIRTLQAENVELEIPEFAQGILAPVMVKATLVNSHNPAKLELEIVDGANNLTQCTPFGLTSPDLGDPRKLDPAR